MYVIKDTLNKFDELCSALGVCKRFGSWKIMLRPEIERHYLQDRCSLKIHLRNLSGQEFTMMLAQRILKDMTFVLGIRVNNLVCNYKVVDFPKDVF